ncbi:hypothetical protein ACIQX3_08520 [Peribacillus frigoritolerans]|uniref:hypothetical protein n=1 Tax=Peribacillus frigoritolerans TaxID=450367 RepID=UPI0037F12165
MKKFATLLPNIWLAKTPQLLAVRRLGGQSAERERISEIKLERLFKKTAGKLVQYGFYCFMNPIGLKKFATLLPNIWLAKTPQPHAVRRLGRQSAERERISEIKLKRLLHKKAAAN